MTNRQRVFIAEYTRDFNATRAAKAAGYSDKTAYSIGQRLLKDVEVADAIKARIEELTMPADEVKLRLAQITALGERMDQGFTRLEAVMTGVEGRVRGLEQREAGCQPIVSSRMDAAWKKIDEHTAELKDLHDAVKALQHANRIITWIAGIAGSSLVLWFMSQIYQAIK